jgi:hypothetical protein
MTAKLILYASSTARDTDFFIKLADQFPSCPTPWKGTESICRTHYARASHRALDPARSTAWCRITVIPIHSR